MCGRSIDTSAVIVSVDHDCRATFYERTDARRELPTVGSEEEVDRMGFQVLPLFHFLSAVRGMKVCVDELTDRRGAVREAKDFYGAARGAEAGSEVLSLRGFSGPVETFKNDELAAHGWRR